MSERLRVPCVHLWWEPHTIIGSGGQHCKGGQAPTVDEVVEWLGVHHDEVIEYWREKPTRQRGRWIAATADLTDAEGDGGK
jgi:hypothetical protein